MDFDYDVRFKIEIENNSIPTAIYLSYKLMNDYGFSVNQGQLFSDDDFGMPCLHFAIMTDNGIVNIWIYDEEEPYKTHCEINTNDNPEYALELYNVLKQFSK